MKPLIKWAVRIGVPSDRLSGNGDLVYIFNRKMDAVRYKEMTLGMLGKVVKVSIAIKEREPK